MATISPYVRKSTKKGNENVFVRFRVSLGRSGSLYYVSDIPMNYDHWDGNNQRLKAKVFMPPAHRLETEKLLLERQGQVTSAYNNLVKKGLPLTSEALTDEVEEIINPPVITEKERSFSDWFDEYREKSNVCYVRKKYYKVVQRNLEKFELYKKISNPDFSLSITEFTTETTYELERFLLDEYIIAEKHPWIYEGEKKTKQRGSNTTAQRIKCVRAFFKWLVDIGKLTRSPYANVPIPKEAYGDPFLLTIDERNQLYKHDFSARPKLEIQRDIFIFQCLVGCRIGDLYRLKKSNVINGAVEYIAEKGRYSSPKTINVPLISIGLEILVKYKNHEGERLFPFISQDKYRDSIKVMLKEADISRIVTIRDSLTGLDIQKPIYEVAASHLARRTLHGNAYKNSKDSAMANSLTGHSPTSRAAFRYRFIDEDMKREVMNSLE